MPNQLLFARLILLAAATLLLAAEPQTGPLSFATPSQAARALLVAAEAGDVSAQTQIFGPGSDEVLSSGDPVQDKNTRAQFVKRARRLLQERIDPANVNRAVL